MERKRIKKVLGTVKKESLFRDPSDKSLMGKVLDLMNRFKKHI